MGTGRLFEERVEELVVHDASLGVIPDQRPDRVLGLRETNNIRDLLEQRSQSHGDDNTGKLRDIVPHTPFKPQPNPLLFPFLVVEAKSDTSKNSFSV